MDIRKQYWLKFYIPIIITIMIIITMILSIKEFDDEGIVKTYYLAGIIIILGLFSCHFILFFLNLLKKYNYKVFNSITIFFFIIYASTTFATFFVADMTVTISTITFFSAIYSMGIILNRLIGKIFKNKIIENENKKNDETLLKNKLPLGWYSRKHYRIIQFTLLLVILAVPLIIFIKWRVLYIILLIAFYFIILLYFSAKQQGILKKIIKQYYDTTDFYYLSNEFKLIRNRNLHPNTLCKINLIEINLMFYHDFEEAEYLLNFLNPDEKFFDKLTYRFTMIDYFYIKEEYTQCLNLINEILYQNHRNKIINQSLINYKHRIEMIINRKPNEIILEAYPTDTPNPYINIINKLIQAEFYYYNHEYDRTRILLTELITGNHDLQTLKQLAQKIMSTIS